MSRFEKCLDILLREEGGYVDHPADPGSATNFGVTLNTWRDYVGYQATKEELHELAVEDVELLYKQRYWTSAGCHMLPPGVDTMVFDAAVNSGPKRAVQWLQLSIGVRPDGIVGKNTVERVLRADAINTIIAMGAYRMVFLAGLSSFGDFGMGWSRRVIRVSLAARRAVDNGIKTEYH